jgi:translation initiation factor IF-2
MIMVSVFILPLRSRLLRSFQVLTSEYAVLLAQEFNRNPVVNDEAAFDIHPV